MVFNSFKIKILPLQHTEGKSNPGLFAHIALVVEACDRLSLKILSPKQILQRLPIILSQVKARNTSEDVLNKIRSSNRQII